jgi:hypothetical protein
VTNCTFDTGNQETAFGRFLPVTSGSKGSVSSSRSRRKATPPRDHRRGGQGLITDLLSTEFKMKKDVNVSASPSKKSTLKSHPTKDEIVLLPAFEGLQLGQIVILESLDQFKDALALIQAAGVVGFDTESKPVFTKEGKSDGPHVVQIALNDRAYIVPIGTNPPIEFLTAVLAQRILSRSDLA